MSGTLYVVASPIGNLGDLTFRAVDVLKEVDLVLCEDTRNSSVLLKHYDIETKTLSYHQHSNISRLDEILNLLISGKNVALLTDAGSPGVSDPGNELIDHLRSKKIDIDIVAVPGPSAVTAALSICGFNVSTFSFIGFWPKKKVSKIIDFIKKVDSPIVFFESPYRIIKTIDRLIEEFGEEKRVFVGQELTKKFERSLRGTLRSVKEDLEIEHKRSGRVKGEIVCIIE